MQRVTVVVPAYNEAAAIPVLHRRLAEICAHEPQYAFDLLFVDDGSSDATIEVVTRLASDDPRIRFISLSRNFGHQAALSAGLDNADGDAVIFLDADLQHPPELISQMLRLWESGAQVVDTVRQDDERLPLIKRLTSNGFYRVLNWLSDVPINRGGADFRLLDRVAADGLRQVNERARFIRGLVQWIGFRHETIAYLPQMRVAGQTKFSLKKMLRLAFDGIFSFSTAPLQLATWLGFSVCVGAIGYAGYAGYAVYVRFVLETAVAGWTSLLLVVLTIGGAQLLSLGIMGGYLSRIYEEVRGRPLYLVKSSSSAPAAQKKDATGLQGRSPSPP
jgi:glycosyltransferase involved in cell wall biosynthesis